MQDLRVALNKVQKMNVHKNHENSLKEHTKFSNPLGKKKSAWSFLKRGEQWKLIMETVL